MLTLNDASQNLLFEIVNLYKLLNKITFSFKGP